jgi:hypothetical protein
MRILIRLALFLCMLLSIPVLAQAVISPGGLTPEKLTSLFDTWSMVIMTVVGLVYTRWPALRAWPNDLVPWINAVGYIAAKLAIPSAHAGVLGAVGGTLSVAGTVAWGAFLSALTSVLYDKYLKFPLDKKLPPAR